MLNLYLSDKLISRLYFAFVPLWFLLLCLLHNVTRDIVKVRLVFRHISLFLFSALPYYVASSRPPSLKPRLDANSSQC